MIAVSLSAALRSLRPVSAVALALLALAGCATRAVDTRPEPPSPAEFADWSCSRIDDELSTVQQQAAEVAYAVDERVGDNIATLGGGLTVFWPALLAMRPDGLEAADLARLKGRYDSLRLASSSKGCAVPGLDLSPAEAARLPVAVGDRLEYEDRIAARQPATPWTLRVVALRRAEMEFELAAPPGGLWLQDRVGNVLHAPTGVVRWQRLLRANLELGQVVAGEMIVVGDPLARARLRGQVVATGPQTVGERRFDAAVIELFGDAPIGEAYTRVDGVIVVDRGSGVLLRLDLRSAHSGFTLKRRLVRVEVAPR